MNIYPSLMVVPEQNLKKEIDTLQPYCAGFHIDIMDNIFVPNQIWNNPMLVNEVVALVSSSPWIHLMVENPMAFYDQLVLPKDTLVSFHIESIVDIFDFSKIIKEKKHRSSLAIRPKTPISEIIQFFDVVDHVLIMSVEPGFSGQHFLFDTFEKIEKLVEYRKKYKSNFKIGIDGGVNKDNIHRLALQGVNDFAIANAIFETDDHLAALHHLQRLIT